MQGFSTFLFGSKLLLPTLLNCDNAGLKLVCTQLHPLFLDQCQAVVQEEIRNTSSPGSRVATAIFQKATERVQIK